MLLKYAKLSNCLSLYFGVHVGYIIIYKTDKNCYVNHNSNSDTAYCLLDAIRVCGIENDTKNRADDPELCLSFSDQKGTEVY